MALPVENKALQDRCDALLSQIDAAATTRQAAYFNAFIGSGDRRRRRGRYFQGILTHPILPADGVPLPPDPTVKPTDQPTSWADANVSLPATMEAACQIDVYDGALGQGWVLTALVRVATRVYAKAINHGPEEWRSHDWRRLPVGAS